LPGLWDAHIHLGAIVPPWDERFRNETEADYGYRCVRKAQDNLRNGVTSLRGMSVRRRGRMPSAATRASCCGLAPIMAAEAGADTIEHGFMISERGIEAMVRFGCVFRLSSR